MLTGCAAVGPDYVEPELAVPDAWHLRIVDQVEQGPEATLQTWWTVFDDPVLNQLIERARDGNLTLQAAAARIRAARASLAVASGARLPEVATAGQASPTMQSDDGWLRLLPVTVLKRRTSMSWGWTPAGKSTCSDVSGAPSNPPRRSTRARLRRSAT